MISNYRRRKNSIVVVAPILFLLSQFVFTDGHADVTTIGPCSENYEECLQGWKVRRVEFLKSETGYLNLAGLFWLKEGETTFGGDSASDIVFPAVATASIGTFTLRNKRVVMAVDPGVDVRLDGQRVARMALPDDTTDSPVVITHGSLAWTVIRRDNQFAVRLRDFERPILDSFESIDYFPTDLSMRVTGKLHRYDEPRVINVGTVIVGLSYNPWSPGIVSFEVDGQAFELEAYDAGGELFFVFGDQTSGRGTYPAGRFLYVEAPGADGNVLLDFNTAQNPPCAFNEFATCPVASPRNRMATRIEAGERFDPSNHWH